MFKFKIRWPWRPNRGVGSPRTSNAHVRSPTHMDADWLSFKRELWRPGFEFKRKLIVRWKRNTRSDNRRALRNYEPVVVVVLSTWQLSNGNRPPNAFKRQSSCAKWVLDCFSVQALGLWICMLDAWYRTVVVLISNAAVFGQVVGVFECEQAQEQGPSR